MRHSRVVPVLAAFSLFAGVTGAAAQEFTWTTASTFNLSGMPAAVAAMMGGKESTQKHYLSGARMRTETGEVATIIDVDGGRYLTLDTRKRTYSEMTFEQMASLASGAQGQAGQSEGGPKFDIEVRRTGESATIAGSKAERHLIIITMQPGAEQLKEDKDAQALAFVLDSWNTTEAPNAAAVKAFQQKFAERVTGRMPGATAAFAAMFSQYEGMEDGLEAATKELQKVEGFAVRTTTHVVALPPGARLDIDAVINRKEQPKEGAGARAAGGLLGRLRAAARQAEQQEAEAEAPGGQRSLLTMTSEVREIRPGGVAEDAFSVPAGYRKQ